jgi:hypothetical protein
MKQVQLQRRKRKKILYANTQSVFNKINELSAVAKDLKPDLILLTMTWCNARIGKALCQFSDYNLEAEMRRDR